MSVLVCFASNDDRGNPTGRFELVTIGDDESVTLERCRGKALAISYPGERSSDVLRVSGQSFLASGHQQWIGNWCWDGTRMPFKEAVRLARWLQGRGFEVTGGPCSGPWSVIWPSWSHVRRYYADVGGEA